MVGLAEGIMVGFAVGEDGRAVGFTDGDAVGDFVITAEG